MASDPMAATAVTATLREQSVACVTLSRVSADVSTVRRDASAVTASLGIGDSRAASPASVTGTLRRVTPRPGPAPAAGTTPAGITVTGPRCDRCSPGYFGSPERPGGECHPCQCNNNIDSRDPESCDPRSGQCLKCLYNTDGPACAACKPGYYGNAAAQDCRRCTCNIAGTLQSQCSGDVCNCDRTTGACPCRANVIGQNCDQCAPEQWNFGRDEGSCNCDPSGSLTLQCDRKTGHCSCVEGVMGSRCDQCARGFTGSFPRCAPCHPCFEEWDELVCTLRRELDKIQEKVKQIQDSGVTSDDSVERIQKLEEKLAQIQSLINDRSRELLYHSVHQTAARLRKEVVQTDRRLQVLSGELNSTMHGEKQQREHLGQLETELRELNDTVTKRQRELENLISAGTSDPCGGANCRDDFGNRKCGGGSCNGTLSASVRALNLVESKTKEIEAAAQDLDNIQKKLQDVAKLTQDIKAQAEGTLTKAHRTKDEIVSSNQKLREFIQKIRDFLTVDGADPKDIELVARQVLSISLPVSASNLTKTIQEIKECMVNLSDVNAFLNATAQQLTIAHKLLEKAKDAKNQADGVKNLVNITKESLDRARSAADTAEKELKKAKKNLKNVLNRTAGDLEEVELKYKELEGKVGGLGDGASSIGSVTERASNIKKEAEELLKKANKDMKQLDDKQMDAMMRLANLSKQAGSVRDKTEQNRVMAEEAKALSEKATEAAAGLDKDLEEVELKYKELEGKVGGLGDGASSIGSVTERASNIKKEAEELLKKANKDMKQLDELEKRFGRNEKRMEAQAKELIDLEKNITSIRNIIRSNVTQYSTCS
ncbi:UNVERIFIED_CONTAM: hypothetical protein FKN15_070320 [Acipenser sinensis]